MERELCKKNNNGIEYYTANELLGFKATKHFFSSKLGGISKGEYNALNLGVYTSDAEANITANFKGIFNETEMHLEKLTYLQQIHSNQFIVVTKENFNEVRGFQGDALITAEKGIAIGVFTADCVPILVVDSQNKIVAAIHAGWKGTDLKIVKKVIGSMIEEMGSKVKDIHCAIGPSIGPCCFEVGKEVADKFDSVSSRNNRLYVDLWKENINQLKELGIGRENIACSRLCTFCMKDSFYSYRREAGKTGRLGAFIEII